MAKNPPDVLRIFPCRRKRCGPNCPHSAIIRQGRLGRTVAPYALHLDEYLRDYQRKMVAANDVEPPANDRQLDLWASKTPGDGSA